MNTTRWIGALFAVVLIAGCAPDPSAKIWADPETVPTNGVSVVSWTSRDVESCRVISSDRGWISWRTEGQHILYRIKDTTTVSITCLGVAFAGERETVSDQATITVHP